MGGVAHSANRFALVGHTANVPARQDRQPGRCGVLAGGELVPAGLERLRRRPDEHHAGRRAGPRQPGVLRQEAVPGVDGVRAGGGRRADDGVDVQVARRRGRRPDRRDLVREPRGHRPGVRVRHGQHRLDAQPPAGADHPRGDLAPVGDQHPPEPVPSAHATVPAQLRITFGHPGSIHISVDALPHGLRVLQADLRDPPARPRVHRVHQLHCLNDRHDRVLAHLVSHLDERRGPWPRRPVKRPGQRCRDGGHPGPVPGAEAPLIPSWARARRRGMPLSRSGRM